MVSSKMSTEEREILSSVIHKYLSGRLVEKG